MDQIHINNISPPPPPRRHPPTTLVISGGGIAGLSLYGAISETNRRGVWTHDNLKRIYSVSAGAALSVCIALKMDWAILDDYMINRPWGNSFRWYNLNFMRAFYDMGIFDKTPIVQFFTPIFAANEISIDVTMSELYELTGVELHIYCVELLSFKYIDMSHITHPNLKIIDAVYRSSTIPFIFKPDIDDSAATAAAPKQIFIDGVFLGNFPSHIHVDSDESDMNNILGFRFNMKAFSLKTNNIIDYIQCLFVSIILHLNKHCINLPRQVTISYDNISFQNIYNTLFTPSYREQLIKIGENYGRDYYIEECGGGGDKGIAPALVGDENV